MKSHCEDMARDVLSFIKAMRILEAAHVTGVDGKEFGVWKLASIWVRSKGRTTI